MKAVLRAIWNWSPVVTLPLCCGYVWWAVETWSDFSTFGIRFDTSPIAYDLEQTGRARLRYLLRDLSQAFLPTGSDPDARPLRTINLFVQESELAALDARLPGSGFDYVRGTLLQGNRSWSVRVRHRGDFVTHWGYPKRSWRIRTRRSSLFEGMRHFNLLAPKYPEQLNNHLGYLLAKEMGLLAPKTELVEFALNGHRRGLHVLVEQIDEGTLRRNARMPGDIYSGELIARDAWRGLPNAVWDQPMLWEKEAVDNHWPRESRAPLLALARLANGEPSAELHERLSSLLDVDAWGRFLAYETLTQCLHYDRSHNWRLYYDSNRRVFVPIVWDPVAWAPASRAFRATEYDMMASRLQTLLLMNGDFLRARHRALRELFESGKAAAFLEEVEQSILDVTSAMRRDPLLRPPNARRVDAAMRAFHASIQRVFDDVRSAFLVDRGELQYAETRDAGERLLKLELDGRRPLSEIELVWSRDLGSGVEAELELLLPDGTWRSHRVPVWIRGSTAVLRLGLVAPVARAFRAPLQLVVDRDRSPRPLSCRVRMRGIDGDRELIDVRCRNEVEPTTEVLRRNDLSPKPVDLLYRAAEHGPGHSTTVWSGEVRLAGVTEMAGGLRIEPGTTVRLAPGASLRLRGRLLAEGTDDRPIRFVPEDGAEPWGALVLEGRRADGSRLRHCEFTGGSGWKTDLFDHSGMLSVHDVGDVYLEHCVFRDNRVVDDAVHVVYSEVRFANCEFRRAFADALDLDICRAEIVDCRFEGSGNDGVDLMTSQCTVVGCRFEGNRDKGISVGEDSRLLAVGNVFEDNVIGVQIKDGSVAGIYNCDFLGNGLALDAYKKNWRYDAGGYGWVGKCRIENNDSAIRADGDSRFHVRDSYLDSEVERHRRYDIAPSVDGSRREKARTGPPELPPELRILDDLATEALRRLRSDRRGS